MDGIGRFGSKYTRYDVVNIIKLNKYFTNVFLQHPFAMFHVVF